jgi:glycosyltransferase involved in cell wall biosynthesis
MDRGGVETWLINLLKNFDPSHIRMDIIVHSRLPGAYDDEARTLGAAIIPVSGPANPLQYVPALYRALRQHGPYDVIHSHVHHFSGIVLAVAAVAGIPLRISHSHNDTRSVERQGSLFRAAYLSGCRTLIKSYANACLAASGEAAESLYGPRWNRSGVTRILYCGVDAGQFMKPVDAAAVRRSLGIQADAFVLGHVGRFEAQKNHSFLLEIFAEVHRVRSNSRLLLIGSGNLEPELRGKCSALGISGGVIFAGLRPDVPRLMLGAMDCFVFPSLYEGLPLALVEAQAAGLPCVVSDKISAEAMIIPALIRSLPAGAGVDAWCNAIVNTSAAKYPNAAAEQIGSSVLGIASSASRLGALYSHGRVPGLMECSS